MNSITLKLYKFKELSENIQLSIINSYINDLLAITDFSSINKNTNLYKAYIACEKMQTPWFLGQYIWDYCNKQILKDLNLKRFFKNGNLFIEGEF